MFISKKSNARRVSVWLLIFALFMLTVLAALPVRATPIMDRPAEIGREAGDAVQNAADSVGDVARGTADRMKSGEGGEVADGDGVIGNEATSDNQATDNQGKAGQVALIVVIVAIVIAVIIIVMLIPKRKRD